MAWWKRKKESGDLEAASVGIFVGAREICVVHVDSTFGAPTQILAWETIVYEALEDFELPLRDFVDRHDLRGHACRIVIASDGYSLRLVERPANVPDEDLSDATRWLVKDLVEFDVDDAELAILTLPEDSRRGRTPHMFVIAARGDFVAAASRAIQGAGLRPVGFEVVETAMVALAQQMPEIVSGSAMLRMDEKASVLTIAQGGDLHLARNLHVDLDAIDRAAQIALSGDSMAPEVMEGVDPLLLDIQRSLDYYESEYGLAPASRLTLLPSPVDTSPLVPILSEALRPLAIEWFEFDTYFAAPSDVPRDLHLSVAMAAGCTTGTSSPIGDALLPTTLRKRQGGFGLASVARMGAAILVLLSIYLGLATWRAELLETEVSALQSRRDLLAAEIDARVSASVAGGVEADPEVEIAALTAELDARRSILRDMTQRSSRRDASFSNLLGGLARQDLESIWLQRIRFSSGGDAIEIEGKSLTPEAIPRYLRRLGSDSGFEDRRFRTFLLERRDDRDPAIAFRLATLDDSQSEDLSGKNGDGQRVYDEEGES